MCSVRGKYFFCNEEVIFTILVMSLTWFVPYFPLIMVYTSEIILLIISNILNVKKALRYDVFIHPWFSFEKQICSRVVAEMWIGYLRLCHNHSIVGLENIPSDGPGKLDDTIWSLEFDLDKFYVRIDSLVPRTCARGLHGSSSQNLQRQEKVKF